MSVRMRWILGLLSFVPLTFSMAFVALFPFFWPLLRSLNHPLAPFWVLLPFNLLAILAVLTLDILFIRHAFTSSEVPSNMRWPWAILLLALCPLAFPVFWYLYVWRTRESAVPLVSAS